MTPNPIIINNSGLPFSFISRVMASEPPPPMTLKTCTRPVIPAVSVILTAVLAVTS